MDRKFVIVSFVFALVGLCLGIYMAASKDHGQLVSHAHIMLIGFLLSFVYGLCHKLWLDSGRGLFPQAQFWLHVVGALCTSLGLFLLYGSIVAPESIEPVLSLGSLAVVIALILMLVMLLKSSKSA